MHACLQQTSFKVNLLFRPFSEVPMRAVLSVNTGLSCSCPLCPSDAVYRWYYKNGDDGQILMLKGFSQGSMTPRKSGTYACGAVWKNGRSFLSKSYDCKFLLMANDIVNSS